MRAPVLIKSAQDRLSEANDADETVVLRQATYSLHTGFGIDYAVKSIDLLSIESSYSVQRKWE